MSKHTSKAKRLKICFIVLLCIALSVFAAKALLNHAARLRMLDAVNLDKGTGLRQLAYAYWRDFLMYCDGYEIMTFAVDEESWSPPDSWIKPAKPTSVLSVAAESGIYLNTTALLKLGFDGENCGMWFFADHRSDRSYDQQDFYFAFCDERDKSNTVLFIYRGHSLYGL